jgi:alkyl hydroperoxide reductase subunit AhpC
LSANTLDSHEKWIQDINEVSGSDLGFPIIADKSRKVAYLYDMIDYQDTTNVDAKGMALTIRAVFFIDPKKVIRAIIYYPASTGRNSTEVLRVIDSLQLTDKHSLVTPIDWKVLPLFNSVANLGSKRTMLSFIHRLTMKRQRSCSLVSALSSLIFVSLRNRRTKIYTMWGLGLSFSQVGM